jgi:hypothetical protein
MEVFIPFALGDNNIGFIIITVESIDINAWWCTWATGANIIGINSEIESVWANLARGSGANKIASWACSLICCKETHASRAFPIH